MKVLFFCLLALCFFDSQEKRVLNIVAGSFQIVPEKEMWEVDSAYITDDSGYSIKISNSNFKEQYKSADTIKTSFYISEMEFLNPSSTLFYVLNLKVKK